MDLFTYEANVYDWDLFGRSPYIETVLHHEPEFIRYYAYF